ncbi:hypothetical protein [Rhodococcus qingshengii]|uniref:hypothetical protein n=1 Tax=Rhodococcus qingshengii TaxID=334542 RepID=UPI001BED3B02|nr:hypothetical protein [Rhodococcus qingshengii]MBT2275893.1 hypothetical protein [Rhodococcus qingshengii]
MNTLPGAEAARIRLQNTALRDFGPPSEQSTSSGPAHQLRLSPQDAPVPVLLKYTLELIGLETLGPAEKVAWSIDFTFKGDHCQIAHEKFGVRLYLTTDTPDESAQNTLNQISKKLRSAVPTVEKLILDAAPAILARGDAIVVNQHHSLEEPYRYFRERASNPNVIPNEHTEHPSPAGGVFISFTFGRLQMKMNSFYDMVAATTAYLSLLEHDLVLALAFTDFDPDTDDLNSVIGARWGDKFDRVAGKSPDAAGYRERLTKIVERWRNPYSHGGNDKVHRAAIYLRVPDVGSVPVGLTRTRHSPLFTLFPASGDDVTDVFTLFDELDEWLTSQLPAAFEWIRSGLPVPFDQKFRAEVQHAQQEGSFTDYLHRADYQQERFDNMDF